MGQRFSKAGMIPPEKEVEQKPTEPPFIGPWVPQNAAIGHLATTDQHLMSERIAYSERQILAESRFRLGKMPSEDPGPVQSSRQSLRSLRSVHSVPIMHTPRALVPQFSQSSMSLAPGRSTPSNGSRSARFSVPYV